MDIKRRAFIKFLIATGGLTLLNPLNINSEEHSSLEKIVNKVRLTKEGRVIEERKLYKSDGKVFDLSPNWNISKSYFNEIDLDHYNLIKNSKLADRITSKYDIFLYDLNFRNKKLIAKDFTGEIANIDNKENTFAYLASNDLTEWSLCNINEGCNNVTGVIRNIFNFNIKDLSSYNFSNSEIPDYLIAGDNDTFHKHYLNQINNDPISLEGAASTLDSDFFSKFIGSVKYPKQLFAINDNLIINDGASWYYLPLRAARKKGIQIQEKVFLESIGNIPAKIKPLKINNSPKLAVFIRNDGINGNIVSALGPNYLEIPVSNALLELYATNIKVKETLSNSLGEYCFYNKSLGDIIKISHPDYYIKTVKIDNNRISGTNEFGFPRINSYLIPKTFPIDFLKSMLLEQLNRATLKFLNPVIPVYLDFNESSNGTVLRNLFEEFIKKEFKDRIGTFIELYKTSNYNDAERGILITNQIEPEEGSLWGWNNEIFFDPSNNEIINGIIKISKEHNFPSETLSIIKWRGFLSALTSFGRTNNFKSIFASLNNPNNLVNEPTKNDRDAVFINYKLQAGSVIE